MSSANTTSIPEEFIVLDSDEVTNPKADAHNPHSSDDENDHAPAAAAPVASLSADEKRFTELKAQLKALGLMYNSTSQTVTELDGSKHDGEAIVKDLRVQVDRLSRELVFAEEEKKDILPTFEKCKRNADLKDRVDVLRHEILEEEATLKKQDHLLRSLDVELSTVTAEYKKKREQRHLFTAELKGLMNGLLSSVVQKVELTAPIDDEDSDEFVHPGDCILQRPVNRRRALALVEHQLAVDALDVTQSEFKQDECAALERDNAAAMQKATEVHDERIRSMVYDFQDQRNFEERL
ncbi:MAR-binding filament-like protein 1-1, putative [Bodo saltans]|uniref:MAR-binding filament-like protein 1-1, putative n=1 Tax=Bodo saltans TaxID=75058 RepID=A0A0S4IYV3_BODSA|nr:MAR-binding filament-like protein 1-1, putative [Bodo saltans]|eukprot:CUG24436.1 MAR-binding filament-like protein 1-1, putative [Bodo saltans]